MKSTFSVWYFMLTVWSLMVAYIGWIMFAVLCIVIFSFFFTRRHTKKTKIYQARLKPKANPAPSWEEEINSDKRKYRVIRFYYQWPQGDDHEILGENLSRIDAERLKSERASILMDDDIILQEMSKGI
jgi:hypothetical protein